MAKSHRRIAATIQTTGFLPRVNPTPLQRFLGRQI
jgi:hypothetical protein